MQKVVFFQCLNLADDLGYNNLSCYRKINQTQNPNTPSCNTPFLNQLAKEGIIFTSFYIGAEMIQEGGDWCNPE